MGLFSKRDKQAQPEKLMTRPYKQCPECLAQLPLNAKKCTECGQRVGAARADGKAALPIDWKSYVVAAIFIMIFIIYIRWAFY